MKTTIILALITATLTGCATTGPSRLEAARTQDEVMQMKTKAFYSDVGYIVAEKTCWANPERCQQNPHKNEQEVPENRRNDRGFWSNFLHRCMDAGKQ